MYFTFTNPTYLFSLAAIPLILLIHVITLRSSKRKALVFANFEAISQVKGVDILSKNLTALLLSIAIVFFLALSVSGLILHTTQQASAFSFVIAIDSSRSMDADDISPNRLEAAKQTSINFIDNSPASTKMAVVSFSGNAFINMYLSDNKEALKAAVLDIEKNPIEGTDIYEVIVTSTNLLMNHEGKSIILLSDGQFNIGNLPEAIKYASDNDIIINTIGLGTLAGGNTGYGTSKLEEEALKSLAYNTGGIYVNAQNKQEIIDSFDKILRVSQREVGISLSGYCVFAAIIVFIVHFFLTNTRYRVFP